jgi:hypothetical protein
MSKLGIFRSAVTTLAVAAACTAGYAVNAAPAWAADNAARGPSAGADQFGDQFVFWRGSTNDRLYEAVHNAYTNSWSSGAIEITQMGQLGSEPAVAVSNVGGYLSNGNRMGAQYVYWEGMNGDLWYGYWTGSWNGPYDTGISDIASEPAAAFNDIGGASQVSVFWKSTTDNSLWYVRIANPASPSPTLFGPHAATDNGNGMGALGSSPGVSNSQPTSGTVLHGPGEVTWKGSTDSGFWRAQYTIDAVTGALTFITGPVQITQYNQINSGPSAAEEANQFFYTWEDSNFNLWFGGENEIGIMRQEELDGENMGSAPAIAWSAANDGADFYIFWKGQDGNLHEAFYNGTVWNYYSYPQFGILG